MKFGTMLKDVSTAFFHKPVTERYPFERRETPDRLRGMLQWQADNCTGCGLCAIDCPANALEVIVLDKKAKRFVIRYQLANCTFCGQCVQSCRHGCLEMNPGMWELAAYKKSSFTHYFGEETDVREALAGKPSANGQPATAD